MKDLAQMTDKELAAEGERLAGERTAIRLAQNAVTAEQETRRALAGVSGATREALIVRMGGAIDSSGEAQS